MNWLQNNYGGNINKEQRKDTYIYRWDIRSKAAEKFLNKILPFVQIKKSQVEVALEFIKLKEGYLTTLKGSQGFRKLSEDEMSRRFELKEKLKSLKKEYKPYIKNVCTNND